MEKKIWEQSFRGPEILDFKLDQGPDEPARSKRSAVDGLLVMIKLQF